MANGSVRRGGERNRAGQIAWAALVGGWLALAGAGCGSTPLTDASAIAVGGFHTCALRRDGTVLCWGSNAFGQLGDGRTDHGQCTGASVDCANSPWPVPALANVVELRAGLDHTCARTTAGAVLCWGDNARGEAGGDGASHTEPTAVPGLGGGADPAVAELALGVEHSCTRTSDGRVLCWGSNALGQLGDGAPAAGTNTPVAVPGITDARGLALGATHTCVLHASGAVSCWGDNSLGQLGTGNTDPSAAPVPVAGLTDAVEVKAGGAHTCARRADGRVVCWGLDAHGELGDGVNPRAVCISGGAEVDCSMLPSQVAGLGEAAEITLGTNHTCARRPSGEVLCWGSNERGQLGDESAMHATCAGGIDCSYYPISIAEVHDAAEVGAGGDHTCLRRAYGDVLCWGDNAYGQVGDTRTHASCNGTDCSYQPTSVTGVH